MLPGTETWKYVKVFYLIVVKERKVDHIDVAYPRTRYLQSR